MADSSDVPPKQTTDNQIGKYYYKHFMFKPIVVVVFLVFLHLFPSQAPEFLNQTLGIKIWEILQLICVGIAVSYGLFSCKTDETAKENDGSSATKTALDNAQSYVSGLLQVSSVFDDDEEEESEGPSVVFDEKIDRSNKIIDQTWRNQYHRGQPRVVMAVNDKTSRIGEKPLLLPVRSLKSRVEVEEEETLQETNDGEKMKSRTLPWRSRSAGRTMEDPEFNKQPEQTKSFRSQSLTRPSSPSPNKLKPSPPPSTDEEIARKKKIPPPPPPPKSSSMKSSSTENKNEEPPRRSYSGRKTQEIYVNDEENAEEEEQEGVVSSRIEEDGHGVVGRDDHGVGKNCGDDNNNSDTDNSGDEEAPDVDKKADEFIARFREQIRLQRIDSIRRSTSAGHGESANKTTL
ncbi:unnamed protein product [Cuscuta europaea]|uniref:Uncharacterized protein n=1 Tax=Cuscuta europaea TaxID=41803 RepID=A0A9P0Z4H8_CUSEU|nr:unnamed protein product [Cuscuta europaea]